MYPRISFVFGTIAENIALHKPSASLEEIMEASQKQELMSLLILFRTGTILFWRAGVLRCRAGEAAFSPPGASRLPQVLILDEATSNLDTVSEKLVHQTIEKLRSERITTILIAHRLSTVVNCDKIFVLDKGLIAEAGTHEELVQADGLYKKLWDGVVV